MYQPRPSIYTPPAPKVVPMRPNGEWRRALTKVRRPKTKVVAKLNYQMKSEQPVCGLPLHISNHSLSIWNSCKRKHLWSHGYGLYPTGTSIHLVAGGSIAAGLEAARRRVFTDPNPTEVSLQQMLHAAYPAFSEAWGDLVPTPAPRLAKTIPNTFDALRYYLEQYHPATDQVQPAIRIDGSPAIEYRFAIPLNILHPSGEPFILIGRFDMLGLIDVYGEIIPCVLDDKTTSTITQNWASSWDMWGQFMCYIWALQQQGVDCNHAVVRGLAIQMSQHKVATAILEYPQFLIDRWERGLYRSLAQMVQAYEAKESHDLNGLREGGLEDYFPYNFGSVCTEYGGCAFSTLCISKEPEDFMSNYIVHRYNPLSHQPVEEIEKSAEEQAA